MTENELRQIETQHWEIPSAHDPAERVAIGTMRQQDRDVSRLIVELRAERERADEWRVQLNHIESLLEDYADDVGASHRVLRGIADVVGFEPGEGG